MGLVCSCTITALVNNSCATADTEMGMDVHDCAMLYYRSRKALACIKVYTVSQVANTACIVLLQS